MRSDNAPLIYRQDYRPHPNAMDQQVNDSAGLSRGLGQCHCRHQSGQNFWQKQRRRQQGHKHQQQPTDTLQAAPFFRQHWFLWQRVQCVYGGWDKACGGRGICGVIIGVASRRAHHLPATALPAIIGICIKTAGSKPPLRPGKIAGQRPRRARCSCRANPPARLSRVPVAKTHGDQGGKKRDQLTRREAAAVAKNRSNADKSSHHDAAAATAAKDQKRGGK